MRTGYAVLVLLLAGCGAPHGALQDSGESFPDAGDAGAQIIDSGVLDAGGSPDDGGSGLDAGGSDSGVTDAGAVDGGSAVDAGSVHTGVLIGGTGTLPGPIAGVHYASGAVDGYTDAQGTFQYFDGSLITFAVSDITFRPVAGAAQLSPWQLVGTGTCTQSAELERLLVLLYSLDADGDPATGTLIGSFPLVAPTRALSGLSMADVVTRVRQLIPGRVALTPAMAVDRFIRQVDDEAWAEIGMDTFSGTTALSRGQGVATDGTSWYFSGTLSLERTDLSFNTQKSIASAIPLALLLAGSRHIGDIDVANGQLYAPIEDGSAYLNPKLVLYDPQSLSSGTIYSIPYSLQTKGVPWVAVDVPRGFIYFAEWDPTSQLNRFALANAQYQSSLALTPPAGTALGRIQGAKVFEGALYLSCDDAAKTVYKLNLDTGTVLRLFSVATTGEEEGLAFLARSDGSAMHTLNVTSSTTGVEFRHHQRTRAPLRKGLCP